MRTGVKSLAERFAEKCIPEPNTGCWLWNGSIDAWGYGRIEVKRVNAGAHRVSYEMFREPIPRGMVVRHSCDTPACVNPDHLQVGTQAENMADMSARRRTFFHRNPHKLMRAERHANAKLTNDQAREIRRRYEAGESQRALAAAFGLCQPTVGKLVTGKTWRTI